MILFKYRSNEKQHKLQHKWIWTVFHRSSGSRSRCWVWRMWSHVCWWLADSFSELVPSEIHGDKNGEVHELNQQMVVNISWYIYILYIYACILIWKRPIRKSRKFYSCAQLEAVDMFWFDDASGPRVPQVFGHLRLPRVEVQVFGHRAGVYLGY